MIIWDYPTHKIDAKFNDTNFLELTIFHLKAGQWEIKTTALNPEVQAKLVEMILEKAKAAKHE